MPEIKAAQITCPICGSADVGHQTRKRLIGDELTGTMEIDEHVDRCGNCGEDGDFAGQNDAIYKAAIAELYQRGAAKMLADLTAKGHSNAHVGRTLGLPQRTLSRWKKDGASASAVTLLKFVATYPWLMEVAERRFDAVHSKQILLREAAEVLKVVMTAENSGAGVPAPSAGQFRVFQSHRQPNASVAAEDTEELALAA